MQLGLRLREFEPADQSRNYLHFEDFEALQAWINPVLPPCLSEGVKEPLEAESQGGQALRSC